MNVVDSSGWVEYFTKGSNAKLFVPLFKTLKIYFPSLCIYEVFRRSHNFKVRLCDALVRN